MVLTATLEDVFRGRLTGGRVDAPCVFGRGGVTDAKTEGDGASPLGLWRMRSLYWRPDRVERPVTGLPVIPIRGDSGWCDAPGHPLYNRPIRLPFQASHEVMRRQDRAYDLVVVLDQNLDRPVPGAGSAIFFHLTKSDEVPSPTEGCIAVSPPVMRQVIRSARVGTPLRIEKG